MSYQQEDDIVANNEPNVSYQYRDINHRSLFALLQHYVVRVFGTVGFLIACVLLSIPLIVMVTIGVVYRLDCPIQDNVPIYLIMSGLVSILVLAWLIVTQLDFRYLQQLQYYVKMHKIQWFLLSMLFIWCILGSYFVFGIAFPKDSECQPTLYRLAFFVVVAQALLFLNICVFMICSGSDCCKYCCRRGPEEPAEPAEM